MISAGQAFPIDALKAKHCPSGTASAKQSCEEEITRLPARYPGIEKVEESKITPLFDAIGKSCYTGDDRKKVKEPAAECFAFALNPSLVEGGKPFTQGKAPAFTAKGKPADKRPVDYTTAANAVGITVDANTSPDTILSAVVKKKEEVALEQGGSVSAKINTGDETNYDILIKSANQLWRSESKRWLLGAELVLNYKTWPKNFPEKTAALSGIEWKDHIFSNKVLAALALTYNLDDPEEKDRTSSAASLKCGIIEYGNFYPGGGCGISASLDVFYKDDSGVRETRDKEFDKLASFGVTVYPMLASTVTPFSLRRNSKVDSEKYAFFEGGLNAGGELSVAGYWVGQYGALGGELTASGALSGNDYKEGDSQSVLSAGVKAPFKVSKLLEGLKGDLSASHDWVTLNDDAETEYTTLAFGANLDLKIATWGDGKRAFGIKGGGNLFLGGPVDAGIEQPAYDPYLGTVITGGVPNPNATFGHDLLLLRAGPYAKLTDNLALDAAYQVYRWSRTEEPGVEDQVDMVSLGLNGTW